MEEIPHLEFNKRKSECLCLDNLEALVWILNGENEKKPVVVFASLIFIKQEEKVNLQYPTYVCGIFFHLFLLL